MNYLNFIFYFLSFLEVQIYSLDVQQIFIFTRFKQVFNQQKVNLNDLFLYLQQDYDMISLLLSVFM